MLDGESTMTGEKILIIDDDDDVCRTMARILKRYGYVVDCAQDGNMGILKVNDHKPDLIITDIFMPSKDGYELIMDVVKQGLDIPIIAITGGGRSHLANSLELASGLGAKATLNKPFDADQLVGAVQSCLYN